MRPLLRDGVGIAAVNGPDSVVISGPEDAVLAIAEEAKATGAGCTSSRSRMRSTRR